MEIAHAYLPQVFAMVTLSFTVALCILATRSGDLISKRKPVSYYEDWDGMGASAAVMRPTRQLANLFEFPVLFYLAIVLAISTGTHDLWLPKLCWLYVGLRWIHAIVHIGLNRLWIRTPVFIASQFALLSIWVRFGITSFSQ